MKYLLLFIPMILLFACEPELEFIEVKEFKNITKKLENNEEVELLYATGSPDKNLDLNYFIHLVAIQKSSGDTVNILTTFNRGGGKGEAKNIFKFYTLNSEEGEAFFRKAHPTFLNNQSENFSVENTLLKIDKVVRDIRFDQIAKNDFETVIGFIDK